MDRNPWSGPEDHGTPSSAHQGVTTALVHWNCLVDRDHLGWMLGGPTSRLASPAHPEIATLTLRTTEMTTDGTTEIWKEDGEREMACLCLPDRKHTPSLCVSVLVFVSVSVSDRLSVSDPLGVSDRLGVSDPVSVSERERD